MNTSCYEFNNDRISKKITFIEYMENNVVEIKYKIIMHWKIDDTCESYTDKIKLSSSKFKEVMKGSDSLCESYEISKKLTSGERHKVIHFIDRKVKYNEGLLKKHKMSKNKADDDEAKLEEFVSNYEYWYVHRREGQPSFEDIDKIEALGENEMFHIRMLKDF